MFFQMLWTTYLVGAGAQDLREFVKLFWTIRMPWDWAYHGTAFAPWVAQFAFGFYSLMLTSMLIGLIAMALYKPRAWCVFCPMGTMTQIVSRLRAGKPEEEQGSCTAAAHPARLAGIRKVDPMREKARKIAALMAQMANENRLLILCALLERPMTVGELAQQVPGVNALSQHLHRLREGRLIKAESMVSCGYSLRDLHLYALMDVLKAEYCGKDTDHLIQND